MEKGVGLVELLIALACSSILFLALYRFYQFSTVTHQEMREAWYCMQSLRQASLRLNADLVQCSYLLPQDLKIAVQGGGLFIAGVPVTSENPGISISPPTPVPYYALINSAVQGGAILDTVDIDNDSHADFWAGLGILTESGPCVIGRTYSRGNTKVPLTCAIMPVQGNRAIPAIHYELRGDGLYRNNELLAEAIVLFQPIISGNDLTISMRSRYNGTEKELSLSYRIQ
jgi:type II secretory pathway component PulJ